MSRGSRSGSRGSKGGGTGRDDKIEEQDYFHGILPREEIISMLQKDGDYLARESRKGGGESQIVLSVKWKGQHKHFIVQIDKGGSFRFEGPTFKSVPELIEFYAKSGTPVTEKSGVILKNRIKQQKWELKHEDVKLDKNLGKGNFGEVYRAFLIAENNAEVAVKTCNLGLAEDDRKKFLREARLMRDYIHPNVVRIIGIAATRDPIMIVMELLPGGALNNYLRKHKGRLSTQEKLKFCLDASAGMEYLQSQKCIHRDLAARNCLLGKNNILKIADFGLSREAAEYKVEGPKQIPIKWTSPEALNHGIFTTKSDVWSYGILMWEIFSEGQGPYPGMTNKEVADEVDKGYRLSAPSAMPSSVADIMQKCWAADPAERPLFCDIKRSLTKIYDKYKS